MQILGDLINLPEPPHLPIPWWHRASLGLAHDTWVHLALIDSAVQSGRRPVGDLVVSVLNPYDWHRMIRVTAWRKESPGVVADLMGAVPPLNIALAESVLLEEGQNFYGFLVLEQFRDTEETLAEAMPNNALFDDFENRLKKNKFDYHQKKLREQKLKVRWSSYEKVDHGWLNTEKWKYEIEEQYSKKDLENIDLTKIVVSADTERRVLRYTFPKRGAMTLRVEHRDRPGALGYIAQAITDSGLNILSGILQRGGAKPKHALLAAVCEPTRQDLSRDSIELLINKKLKEIAPRYEIDHRVSYGLNPKSIVYVKHPDQLMVNLPSTLQDKICQIKSKWPSKHGIPVFISHPVYVSKRSRQNMILDVVKETLIENGCIPVDAPPLPTHPDQIAYIEVRSRLWACKACIILGGARPRAAGTALTRSMAHEWGYMEGQGKPTLLLVPGRQYQQAVRDFPNVFGVTAGPFASGNNAFNPTEDFSISRIIGNWVESFRHIV